MYHTYQSNKNIEPNEINEEDNSCYKKPHDFDRRLGYEEDNLLRFSTEIEQIVRKIVEKVKNEHSHY